MGGSSRSIRVLHVDDEPDFADTVATFLELENERFDVATATAADAGLNRLRDGAFDCVVSDYDMPGQNGIEFLRAVREDYPNLPFILYTGKGSEEVASDAISAGVTDYLQKGGGAGQYTVLANRVANAVERSRAQEALAERTRRLETLIDNLPGMVYRCKNTPDWPMETVEGEVESLTGYSANALESDDVLWGEDVLHPDDREPMWDAVQEGFSENGSFEVTYRIITKDGTEKWAWERGRGVYTDGDDLEALEGFITDITERTEREQELRRTLEFLQTLYDVATDTDAEFEEKIDRLLTIGHEKLDLPYGHLTRIEVTDEDAGAGTQTVIEATGDHELLQPGDSCPLSQSYCRTTIKRDGLTAIHDATEAGWEGDPAYEAFNLGCYIGIKLTVDDELYGTVFFASATPRDEPFTHAERTFVRLLSQLVQYELERDRIWREVQQKNARLEEFASVVSHDLQSPLDVAAGRVELAREECDSDHLDAAARAHDRMERLIDELLTVACAGEQAYTIERVDLPAVAEASWETVETAEATLSVRSDLTIRADRGRLRQALTNLFQNAVDHAGSDVIVTIAEVADGFSIADDGPGIPGDEREQVFDAGYSTAPDGTGFGLTIVEQIVHAHGWEISVTESDNGGARFEITDVDTVE